MGTFAEKEKYCNKFYWDRNDIKEFFEISYPKATEEKKKVFKYMEENKIPKIDSRRMSFKTIKDALGIDEDYIRKQARKELVRKED